MIQKSLAKIRRIQIPGWGVFSLKLAISTAVVISLSTQFPLVEAGSHLRNAQPAQASLAFGLLGVSHFLSGVRWHFASANVLPLTSCLRYTWTAQFYALILPGAFTADLAKGVAMTAKGDSDCRVSLATSIILDRTAGLGTLLIFGLLSCIARPDLIPVPSPLLFSGAVIGLTILLSLARLLRAILARFDPSRRHVRLHSLFDSMSWRRWIAVISLSILIHAVNITFYQVSLSAVGGRETWFELALYTFILNLALILPVSIGGVGLREQIAVSLFQSSSNAPVQIAFGWIVFILTFIHGLVGLWIQWRGKAQIGRTVDESPET
jgi:uncharacterized membrane protein YbhN (UPF0104 family)